MVVRSYYSEIDLLLTPSFLAGSVASQITAGAGSVASDITSLGAGVFQTVTCVWIYKVSDSVWLSDFPIFL